MKTQHKNPFGNMKAVLQGQFTALRTYIKKIRKSTNKGLKGLTKNLEKQTKFKTTRQQ